MQGTTIAALVIAALAWAAAASDARAVRGDIEAGKTGSEKDYRGVRQQQGRVQTDSDTNSSAARKLPGMSKYGDITLKRGIISRDAAIAQRRALKPLKERVSTRGMRTAEAAYAEKLRKWALAQDKRLLELQKIHSAYDRLKDYRDRAALKGEDLARIDPRLDGMEKKMAVLSKEIQLARANLKQLMSRYQGELKAMSSIMKTQHDAAMGVIRKTDG